MNNAETHEHAETPERIDYEAPSFEIVDLKDTVGDSRGSGAMGGGGFESGPT